MGRHRPSNKSTPTATYLIARLAEEEDLPTEPRTAEIELIFDGVPRTDELPVIDGRLVLPPVPVYVHWVTATGLLPEDLPVAAPGDVQDAPEDAPRTSGAHRAPEPS